MLMLNDKFEAALKVVIASATSIKINLGRDAEDRTLPLIICSAQAADQEDPIGTGNFFVDWQVAIKQSAVPNEDGTSQADGAAAQATEAETAAKSTVETLLGVLAVDDLAAQLTAAVDALQVFSGSVQFTATESGRDEAGVWVDVIRGRAYACGQAL